MPWFCHNCKKHPETLVWPVNDYTYWRGTNSETGRGADYVSSLDDVVPSNPEQWAKFKDYDGSAEFEDEPVGCGDCGSRDIEWQDIAPTRPDR